MERRSRRENPELDAERMTELGTRSDQRRAAASSAATHLASVRRVVGHTTRAGAEAAAVKACASLCDVEVGTHEGLFYPVVVLRPDQRWMRSQIEERGALFRQQEFAPDAG